VTEETVNYLNTTLYIYICETPFTVDFKYLVMARSQIIRHNELLAFSVFFRKIFTDLISGNKTQVLES